MHHEHSIQIARQAQVHMDASSFKKLASHWLCHHLTETFLMLEAPGWSVELSAQWIITWCGDSFAYQSNLKPGWMWPNHLKSWTPPNWSNLSVLMLWDQLCKQLLADWLRIHQMLNNAVLNTLGKSSANIRIGLMKANKLYKTSYELRQPYIRFISNTLTQLPNN